MVAIFAFIDFQHVFSPEENTSWCVPKFHSALKTALSTWTKLKDKVIPVATSYIPPCHISGIWKKYFDEYPNIPKDPSNDIYNLDSNISKIDIYKPRVTSFSKWNILQDLFQNDLSKNDTENTLYLCGVATDCCVLSTALDAVDAGVKVILINDACASGNDENHERALKIMQGYYPNIEIKNSFSF